MTHCNINDSRLSLSSQRRAIIDCPCAVLADFTVVYQGLILSLSVTLPTEINKDSLRKDVRDIFNCAFCKCPDENTQVIIPYYMFGEFVIYLHVANACGKMRRCLYIHMDQRRFAVSGMPDNVPFKCPKDYNTTELSAIIANKDAIKIHGRLI